ncbi:MAG: hypothetical protein AAFV53_42760, partial [Myxococcota bacterium]
MDILVPVLLFSNGTNQHDWPNGGFRPSITLIATSTELTIAGILQNGSDHVYGTPTALQATATVYINGTSSTSLNIDSQSYVISGAPISVSAGDEVTVRLESKATSHAPYETRLVQRQDLTWTVPLGGGVHAFDAVTNP